MKMKKWLKCLLMTMALMMVVNVGMVSTTIPAAAKARTQTVKVGTTFKSGNFKYRVTSLKGKRGTAMLVGTTSKKIISVEVPETVKAGKYTLTVNEIGDKAFQKCTKLTEVVTNTSIKKIGKKVFSGCSSLEEVEIRSEKLKKAGKDALKGLPKKAVITVPNGKDTDYEKLLNVSVQTVAEAEAPAGPQTEAMQAETAAAPAAPETPETGTPAALAAEKTAETAPSAPSVQSAPAVQNTPAVQSTPTVHNALASAAPGTKSMQAAAPKKEAQTEASCGRKHLGLVVVESVAPTCTETGLSSYEYCTVCGYETKPLVLSALGHELVHHPGIPATCTKEGLTGYDTCTRCGYATQPTVTAKTSHVMETVQGRSATCTAGGWTEYQACRDCGLRVGYQSLPALGHSLGPWITVKEATCTEAGAEEQKCERCGAKAKRTIDAKGHHYVFQERRPIHGKGSDCYDYAVFSCTVCGAENLSPSAGHRTDVLIPAEDIPATCTTAGRTDRKVCPNCDYETYTYVKPLGHNFCTEQIVEEPTCTKEGLAYRKCVRCDARTAVTSIPKIDHTWAEEHTTVTCTEDGTDGRVCTVCGLREETVANATGHKYQTTKLVQPVCGVDGSRTERCSECGDERTTVLPAVSHKWVKYEEKLATCGAAGHSAYEKCSLCGAYKDDKQPQTYEALTHKWSDANPVSIRKIVTIADDDRNCDMTGFVTCEHCGALKVVPRRGHNPDNDSCGYNIAKRSGGNVSGYIQWTVFLSETDWGTVPDGFASNCYRYRVWMNGKMYYAFIPARRSDVTFAAPGLAGSFAGWQQMVTGTDGSVVPFGEVRAADSVFTADDAGKTFVAVFNS